MTGPVVQRLRVAACCALLTGLAFWQQPGRIVPDTKVDLVVAPGAWLARALHAWEPTGNFGQMQNQAYGYLWPMGPFFALGKLVGVPVWAVQRLWWALLLCLAFTGVVLLAGRLGIGTPAARLFGGLAFALSPRILSELGPVSVEAWPSAIAPWVLIPLVGVTPGRLRRAAALSGLAVACAGGVNATAVLAVLPLPMLWLLTLRPLRWRLTVAAAWGVAVACATAWWVVPLLLLGRYSPPFLDYIETAATTTSSTDVVSATRGASHWLAYLGNPYGPLWPAGNRLAVTVPLVVATMVVAGSGLAGLSRRGLPHRGFLITAALAGVALVGLGHLSAAPGAGAGFLHAWLDAGGAPLRNLHKFDVLLRLPLTLGLIHLSGLAMRLATTRAAPPTTMLLAAAPASAAPPAPAAAPSHSADRRASLDAAPPHSAGRLAALGGLVAAVTAVVVAALPVLSGGLPGPGTISEIPGYWRSATAWLDAHAGRSRTLVVPGARFPSYLWGAPGDEMVQPLMSTGWAVRNSNPLVPPATVRLLDTVESVLTAGRGSPGLAELLARSGVRYLLVRADLETGRTDASRQLTVRAALDGSPGLRSVATFGPSVGGHPPAFSVDRGLDVPVPALEVYEVADPAGPVSAYDLTDARTVVGGPESLLELADTGQLSRAPTVLATDVPPGLTTGGTVVTDGQRRRETIFGQARDNVSATMTAAEPWRLDQPAHDYTTVDDPARQTVARYLGVRGVNASSSYSQALPLTSNRPEHQPYAAIDGDPSTSWRSAPGTAAVGQWLTVALDRPRRIDQIQITFDRGADAIPTQVTVWAGEEEHEVPVAGATVTVPLDGWFPISEVTIQINTVWSVRLGQGGVGIAELTIPGVSARRTLVLPAESAPGGPAPAVVLATAPSVPSCFYLDTLPYCAATTARGSEDGTVLDRTVPWSLPGDYDVRLWARPRAGPAVDALLDRAIAGPDTPHVTASSTGVADPAARAGVVVDGSDDSVWYASDEDRTPWLRLDWSTPRTVTGVRITLGERAAAAHPWAVNVLTDAGSRAGSLAANGWLTLDPPARTDDLTVLFTGGPDAVDFDAYANRFSNLPIGVGEVTVASDRGPARLGGGAATVIRAPCGAGPPVSIAGRGIRTSFTATVADLLARRELPMRLCGTDRIRPGASPRVVATGSAAAEPTRLALLPVGGTAAGTPVDSVLSVDRWDAGRRQVTLAARPAQRILVVRENANAGWHARLGNVPLRPIVVDGWQQGWIVPAWPSGPVTMEFTPDQPYRAGLAGGAVLLAAVAVAALLPPGPTRAAPPPARRRRRGDIVQFLLGAVFLLVAGGYTTVACTAFGALALLAARAPTEQRRLSRVSRWAPATLFAIACVLSLRSATPHTALWPQVAGLAAFVSLWLGTAPFFRHS